MPNNPKFVIDRMALLLSFLVYFNSVPNTTTMSRAKYFLFTLKIIIMGALWCRKTFLIFAKITLALSILPGERKQKRILKVKNITILCS